LISLACGAGGAWAFEQFGPKPEAPPAPQPAVAAPAPARVEDKSEYSKAEETKRLADSVTHLSDRLDHVQERLAAMPTPQPPPDLKSLQNEIDELIKDQKTLADVPARLSALDQRITTIDKAIANMRAQGKTSSGGGPRTSISRAIQPEVASRAFDRFPPGSELAQGAELFRQGKYSRALEVFKKLEGSTPDDARIWYFAALSRGLSSGQWNGECARLAEEGVEWERAGKPDSAIVDATFAELTKATGKDWLASHRKHTDSPR
jgi:hypothetical protein